MGAESPGTRPLARSELVKQLEELAEERDLVQQERDALRERYAELERRHRSQEHALRNLLDEKIAHDRQIEELGQRIAEMRRSLAWRIALPLRLALFVARALGRPRTRSRAALLRAVRLAFRLVPGPPAQKLRWRKRFVRYFGWALPAGDPRSQVALRAKPHSAPLPPELESLVENCRADEAAIFSIEAAIEEAEQAIASGALDADSALGHPAATLLELRRQNGSGERAREIYAQRGRERIAAHLSENRRMRFPTPESPLVSIVLALWNQAGLTLLCLESLRKCAGTPFELIVVDNASTDETRELLASLDGVTVIENRENVGFLRAVNQGLEIARGEFVLLLNNDAQLFPQALEKLVAALRANPDAGAVGGRIVLLDGALQEAGSIIWRDGSCLGYGRGRHPDEPAFLFRRDIDYGSGCLLLVRRALFQEVGGFDLRFAPAYYEEADLCMELRGRGHRVLYEPDAVLLHFEFGSSRTRDDAIEQQRRNQQRFVAKHRGALQSHLLPEVAAIERARSSERWQPRVLVLDDRVPHRGLGQGLPRANDLLHALRELGYAVTMFPTTLPHEHWRTLYADIPREIELIHGRGVAQLEAFLEERRGCFDRILVSRPHNMGFLQEIRSSRPEIFGDLEIVYDAEAIFALREYERARVLGEVTSERVVAQRIREEVELASSAAAILTVSEREAAHFRSAGGPAVHVVGHCLDSRPTRTPHAERRDFLFVGSMQDDATPNVDSVAWFVEQVWPLVKRELPDDVLLHLVGPTGATKLKAIQAYHGTKLRVHGFVEDPTRFYERARVFLVPTRYAGGIPYKAHEAASRGLPMVASPLIASQLAWHDERELLVGRDPEHFAAQCLRLYHEESLWERTRQAALFAIERECSRRGFLSALETAFGRASERRAQEAAAA
jgi:GT2 family glycosyltransferase/glycosyltransferase involved in cell wall biosynthesis